MKKLIMLIGFLVAMYLMFSCSKLQEGHVVEKWYEPARTWTSMIPMTVGKTTTMIPERGPQTQFFTIIFSV